MEISPLSSEVVPGLEIRSMLALARVELQLYPDNAHATLHHVANVVRYMAHKAVDHGNHVAPNMIQSDEWLHSLWNEGIRSSMSI